MKTREEQLQEWRERRGIQRATLRQKPPSSSSIPHPPVAKPGVIPNSINSNKDAAYPNETRYSPCMDDKENATQDQGFGLSYGTAKDNQQGREPQRPSFMAPTMSSQQHTARQSFLHSAVSVQPRDSTASLGLQHDNSSGVGNLLRERMSILCRDSMVPQTNAEHVPRWSMMESDIGNPGDAKIPCLQSMAKSLFEAPEIQQQCDKALNWQLKSSKDGATKDSRIAELAELTKLARRLLKQVRLMLACTVQISI